MGFDPLSMMASGIATAVGATAENSPHLAKQAATSSIADAAMGVAKEAGKQEKPSLLSQFGTAAKGLGEVAGGGAQISQALRGPQQAPVQAFNPQIQMPGAPQQLAMPQAPDLVSMLQQIQGR